MEPMCRVVDQRGKEHACMLNTHAVRMQRDAQ